ncbi:hypothetical protein HA402_003529 [Bradysia odoriphaga]|nr:hypothetical protein HA402_003529 [Bradysia odoriphaga]
MADAVGGQQQQQEAPPEWNAEECDSHSFDDSDRFEEDSLCSWSSEPESLCNNWRGWKRPITASTFGNGGVRKTADEPQVTTLTELAAKCVASFIPFELVEHVYPPVPEQLQLRIAYWSFPDNEEDIRLYSCLANSSADEFHRGDQLFKNRLVKDSLQIGFHLSATVVHCSPPRTQFNVAVTFDRRRISSCNCTCSSAAYWCSHVVAVCLHRIHCPNEVCLRAPVSESLTRLQRDQLQKFAQYLISELPQQILPTAQRLLDELLSCQPTAINTVCGAPDPTAGASANDQTNWYLDEKTLHDNIKKILIKFCLPAPMVFSDVNYLTNSAPPAAAEWSSLLRPLRGREPEGMWNLLLIVREMYRRCDRNAIRLLEIITEECMVCDQILVWWFNTKLSLLFGTGGHTGGKHSNTHSNANASQHACSSLCDEIVILWRLAALNPGLAPDERDMLHAQFTAWHLKILDRIVKCRVQSSSYSNKHQNNLRTDAELFIGFKPAIEACYLDWEDYQIPGITHTQDTNPMYHCPFTCFKHTDSKCDTQSQVNSSQAVLSTHKRYNYIISDHHHQLKRSYRAYASSSNNSSNSSSDSVNLGRNPLPNEPDDCNRSSASSEGFCENEDDGVDSTVLEHSQATEDVSDTNKSSGTEMTTTTKVKSNENDSQGGDSSSSSVVLDDCKSNRKNSNNVNKTMTSVSTSLTSNFSNSNVVNNSASVNSKNANIFSVSKSNNIVNYEDDAIAGSSSSTSTSPAITAPSTKSANEPNPSVSSSLSSFNAKYLQPVPAANINATTISSSSSSLLPATTSTLAIPSTSNTFVPQPSTSRGDVAVVEKSTEPKTDTVEEDRRPSKDESVSSSGSQQSDEFNMYYYDSKTNQNKLLEQQAKIDQGTNKAQIFSNIKPTEDAWDILFARAEGLHAHGHGREACYLAVRLAEEMLAHPPNLMIEMPPPMKRKGKKMNVNPISHQLSVLASGTLSKCAFLCIVLAENSEHYHLSFRICLFGLEMPRPPASTKPLEVKLANQEADLLGLLKRIPLGHMELNVIREKAEKLRDGQLRSRGEALLPIMLASFIFDALVMPSVAGKERLKVMSMSYRIPTDENLGFEAAVAALGLKANVSEAEHPLLCEGTRRQRGDLALTLLYYYKDEPRKIARIMDKLIDREIHTLIKTQLLPSYYSNNPPVRTQAAQARREEQDLAAHYNNEHFQNDFCTNSRPHSSTSAELEIGMSAMCLSQQNTPTTSNNQGQPVAPTITNTNARSKESRYKGKRIYPSIPNQPSEASAHFMFELAKNVLTKAGGTSSTSLFTQATTNQNHHGPHRALHMCAFQLGLYALGLHNCVSSNWLSRTYSSHVSWILGQAMEIGAPAISFLIDTWEGHLTPPEAAGMADRASRGWDSNMVYPSAELALSVLPHAAALNPNEITRAILQCKEQSDQMLERACFTVEHAAKGGGVYPEVLFQVAKYWYELYMRNSPHGHDIHDDNHHVDHNVQLAAIMDVSDMQQQSQPVPNPQVVVTASPPQPYQPGVTTIAPIYGPYGFACQGIYHHHNIAYPHNQMQMYISAPQAFQYPPPTNQPPPFVHQPVGATFQSMNHSAVTPSGFTAMQCPTGQQFQVPVQVPPPTPNVQIQPNMQFFVPPPALPPNAMRTQPPPQVGSLNQPPPNQQIQQQTMQQMQPHGVVYGNTFIQPPPAHPPQRQRHIHHFSPQQLRYLLAAYNVGMLAMETLARRVHDDRPQAKYARNPPYGEDVKWLLQISKKLGTQYLHQFCVCAVNSIVSPFVLHDVALESAHFLARNNPTLVMQHLRSALTPLVQKCQQMYIQCIHQKLYHLTAADYEDFASIILAARAAFQITPEGNNQFKDWIQTIRRSKSCKKDLWAQINTALQSNSK